MARVKLHARHAALRWRGRAQRLTLPTASWQQLLLVVAGVAVTAAMVIVAELAREDADQHRRGQVLVETIRASSQELNAIRAQALVDALTSRAARVEIPASLVKSGFSVWSQLAGALRQLRALEPDTRTALLQSDSAALYVLGLNTLAVANGRTIPAALHDEQLRFVPVLTRLNTDAVRASSYERRTADEASSNALTAFIGSLEIGLIALLAIGWRFQRVRRRTILNAERLAIEERSEARLRALVEHSTDVVTVIGSDLLVKWQAPSLERVLGHAPETMIGRALAELVHPDDAPQVQRFSGRQPREPRQSHVSARFTHADGDWRAVETVVDNRLEDPAVGGLGAQHARRHRPQGARGRAAPPGVPRFADWARQPAAVRGPPGSCDRDRHSRRPRVRGAVPRPRRLQDDQRQPRPRARRRAAARGRIADPGDPAAQRYRRPARRRRVRAADRGDRR